MNFEDHANNTTRVRIFTYKLGFLLFVFTNYMLIIINIFIIYLYLLF